MKLQLLFLTAFLSFLTANAQIPTTALIKDYKFTNGALTSDLNPLLYAGTTTLVPTGSARTIITDRNDEADKALILNGDSFVAGGTNAATVNSFAISFWIKTTTNESPKRFIFDQHNTAANPAGFSVSLKDGKIYFNGQYSWNFQTTSGASGVQEVISAPLNDGSWHHVVCELSSTSSLLYAGSLSQYTLTYTYSMYVDTVFVSSDSETNYASGLTSESYSVRAMTPTKQLVIGKSPDGLHLDYQDGIDQIRYYETTLTNAGREALFNEDAPETPIYVNPLAAGLNNGTSWANAYTNLQTAITNAGSNNPICVIAGTYKPTGAGRNATFMISGAKQIYGGFNGTETALSQRNPKINTTILSGDLNGNDNATITAAETTRQDNAYHVLTVRGNSPTVILDGFTITGGNANGPTLTTGAAVSQFYHTRGGALYINTYNPTDVANVYVKNCILEKNSGSDTGVSAGYFPGGIQNQTYRSDFESCIIRNNFSGTNSQILIGGANGFNWFAYGKIENCLFNNNVSTSGASCLYLSASETNSGNQLGIRADIINSTFADNTGTSGQVIRSHNASNCFFRNSIIYNNGSNTPFTFTGALGGPSLSNTFSQGGQISGQNVNPLLNADFTLQPTSPAINSGNNTHISAGLIYDLNGNSRIVNTTVDLGAFEYDSNLLANDSNVFHDFTVYPNPTKGHLTVQMEGQIKEIEIFTLLGSKIASSTQSQMDISDLSDGIYLVVIHTQDGKTGMRRIVKN